MTDPAPVLTCFGACRSAQPHALEGDSTYRCRTCGGVRGAPLETTPTPALVREYEAALSEMAQAQARRLHAIALIAAGDTELAQLADKLASANTVLAEKIDALEEELREMRERDLTPRGGGE